MVRRAKLSSRTLWRIFWELIALIVACVIGVGFGLWLAPIIKADNGNVYV